MTEPIYGCDRCNRVAEWISVLPDLDRRPTVARVTCEAHAPNGALDAYVFPVEHYWHALRAHLLTKRYGAAAVALVDEALELVRCAA